MLRLGGQGGIGLGETKKIIIHLELRDKLKTIIWRICGGVRRRPGPCTVASRANQCIKLATHEYKIVSKTKF